MLKEKIRCLDLTRQDRSIEKAKRDRSKRSTDPKFVERADEC
jgi:hypothetical protein